MGFLNHVGLWEDVLEPCLDEKAAPSLGGVHLGSEERIYSNSVEFFRRTLITCHMVEALENVVDALAGRGGNKLIMLLSLFGGGKTHTLLTIYHAFRNPTALLDARTVDEEMREHLQRLTGELSKIGEVRIVVLDGYFSELMPNPVNPLQVPGYKVQTIWGSLAHQLGRFGDVRENDEKLLAPPADIIAKLLGDKPVIIFIDEIADYIVKLKSAGDPTLRNYADQVLSFIESLAKAVDLSRNTVLIISMPVEERRKGLEVEERYKSSFNVIVSIYKSVSRVAARRIIPVSHSDIPSILKVRLFRDIDSKVAKAITSNLARVYSSKENVEIFGEEAVRKAHEVEKTYPFHPSYIETLVSIVDKHEGLEKTRDAIRITRKVVRRLVNTKSDAELIMPFHIDVEDDEIRGTLLSHELYRQYATIVEEDIVERIKSYEKPELAKIIAKTILVKTFVYVGSVRYHQLYPDKHEIMISSFEPNMSRALNIHPKDYLDALNWTASNLVYLLNEGGRYWFTQFASPIRMVEMRARMIDDHEALKKVQYYACELLSKPFEDVVSGTRRCSSKRGEVYRLPFSSSSSMVMLEPKPIDHDSGEYVLLAILSPLKEDEIEKIIYETSGGGSRRNANTIYLIYPRDSNSVSQMLVFAKHLIACEIVSNELDTIYKDSEIREVMRKKLEKYRRGMEGVEGKLVVNILAGLNTVAYPYFDEQAHKNTFKVTEASMADTIIETATRALKNARPPKLYEELDFEELEHMLSQAGIDLAEGNTARPVFDVIDYFYSNPRLPMVRKETIEEALMEGVKCLKIGVRRSDKIYFKKIYEHGDAESRTLPSIEEGEIPDRLEPDDIILPWRRALQEQLEKLKETSEEKVSGGIRRIWHAFYIDGDLIPVAEALEDYDLEILRYSPLVRVVEFIQEGIDVKLDKYKVTVAPGEEIFVNVTIERVGSFKGEVSLSVTEGQLSRERIDIGDQRPSAVIQWRVKAPENPGMYRCEVRATSSSGEILKTVVMTVIGKPRELKVIKGIPPRGTKLLLIEVGVNHFNLKPIGIIESKFSSQCEVEEATLELEAAFDNRSPKVSLTLNSVALEDVKVIFSTITHKYGISIKHMQYKILLKPHGREYIIAPEFSEDEKTELKDYMTCYIYG